MASFFTALSFIALLESSLTVPAVGFWFPSSLAVVLAGAHFLRRFKSTSLLLLALSLAVLAVSFLYFSNNVFFSQSVIMASGAALYATALACARRSFSFAVGVSFVLLLGSLFALSRFHVLSNASLFAIVPAIFFVTGFFFFLSERIALPSLGQALKVRLFIFSLLVGFLVGEAYVVFSKLPFTMITIDFMLFIMYYTIWSMAFRYFSGTFTKRSLVSGLALCAFSFAALLFSASWFWI